MSITKVLKVYSVFYFLATLNSQEHKKNSNPFSCTGGSYGHEVLATSFS